MWLYYIDKQEKPDIFFNNVYVSNVILLIPVYRRHRCQLMHQLPPLSRPRPPRLLPPHRRGHWYRPSQPRLGHRRLRVDLGGRHVTRKSTSWRCCAEIRTRTLMTRRMMLVGVCLFDSHCLLKGTPLWFGRVTHKKVNNPKHIFTSYQCF